MAFVRSRTGHPRYKRAGFEFSGDWSEIDFARLSEEKRKLLEQDPHLQIKAELSPPAATKIDVPTETAPVAAPPEAAKPAGDEPKAEADEKKPAKSPPKPAAPPK